MRLVPASVLIVVVLLLQGCATTSSQLPCPAAGTQEHSLATLGRLKDGRPRRASSTDPNWRTGNADARPIAPGEKLVIADLNGPGSIQHIWFTINADPGFARYVSLHFYWDDEPFPSVTSPLGDFFAVGNGMIEWVNSAVVMVSSDGKAYNCYWPMPFHKKARLEVHNDSTDKRVHALYYYVDWIEYDALPELTPYFHAHYRQEHPAVQGRDYRFLKTTGRGHYVGTVYSVLHTEAGWFGEGDDRFYIDGEEEPSLNGTGTEDYFSDAWGFRKFNHPYHGVTVWEGYNAGDRGTAYRWHILDPIPFKESLLVEIEHWGSRHYPDGSMNGFVERADYLSSVAFWYQLEPSPEMEPLPPARERMPSTIVIEGEALEPSAVVTHGQRIIQPLGGTSGGSQFLIASDNPKTTTTVTFDVPAEGDYVIELLLTRSFDYGTFRITLNDQELIGNLNLYSEYVVTKPHRFPTRRLQAGTYTLRFEAVGADPRSKLINGSGPGYYLGLDAIVLTRF